MAMLTADLSGQAYSKAEHNRALQQLIGRGRGSIEYKHQNISAVLKGIGETELAGYKPAFNYQASLEDAVDRWLAKRPGWYAHRPHKTAPARVQETGALWIGTAPTLQNAPSPDEADQMARIARRFDAAGRDDRNRKLGRAGEERVVDHERASLSAGGRGDLGASTRLDAETAELFRGRNLAVVGDADQAGAQFSKRMYDVFASLGHTIGRKRLPEQCNDLNDYLLLQRKKTHELA